MQIFRKIVRKVFEISHFWGVFCIRIFRSRSGTLPVAKFDLLREKANAHLEGERLWHMAICDIFDERRAAPPAYGRRAWSKVVSYLDFFINFPKLIRVQALPEYQNGFN